MYTEILTSELDKLKLNEQSREYVSINRIRGQYPFVRINEAKTSKRAITWCSNDYLGMSQNPSVIEAMHKAIDSFGVGSGGSRNIGGTSDEYIKLESSLADWHNKKAALVFPTGYASNDVTLQCLLRALNDCVVFSDENNHASIIKGIQSARSKCFIFKHNNVKHLESLLESQPLCRPKVIVFESIYSMDGDIAPVEEITRLARKYKALTFLDEVHSVGMYGCRGSGIAATRGVEDQIDIIQGTMAKAIGVIGGYIASSTTIIDTVRSFGTGFIFTTSLPPAIVSACYTSIEHLKVSNEERIGLHRNVNILRMAFNTADIPITSSSQTHIIPVIIGNAKKCKNIARYLLDRHNIYLQPINSPTVPVGSERFRITITPNHTEEHIMLLTYALVEAFHLFEVPFMSQLNYELA